MSNVALVVVAESCNQAGLYGSFESTLFIRVNFITDRASVIFLVTPGKTGCSDCFCLCEVVGASKFIYGSAFVTLIVANRTFLVLDTFSINGGIDVNFPFVVVRNLFDDFFSCCLVVVTYSTIFAAGYTGCGTGSIDASDATVFVVRNLSILP